MRIDMFPKIKCKPYDLFRDSDSEVLKGLKLKSSEGKSVEVTIVVHFKRMNRGR